MGDLAHLQCDFGTAQPVRLLCNALAVRSAAGNDTNVLSRVVSLVSSQASLHKERYLRHKEQYLFLAKLLAMTNSPERMDQAPLQLGSSAQATALGA